MNNRNQQEKAFFDELSGQKRFLSFYQEFYELGFGRPFKEYFLDLLGDLSGQVVLEYGCGSYGDLFINLVNHHPQEIISVDLSFDSLVNNRKTVQRQHPDIQMNIARSDCHRLPFDHGSFDLVVGRAILHHLNTPAALREIRRVLKPEGRAIFIEPLGTNPLISIYRALTPANRTPEEHPFTIPEIDSFNKYFSRVTHKEFNLFTLPVLLLAKVYKDRKTLERILFQARELERTMFGYFPWLQRYSWTTVIELS
ncbi:MAG: methyltransferase domain-containing protein [bacterium]